MLDLQRLKELRAKVSLAPWEWGLGGWLYSRASCDQVIETRRINNGTDSIVEVSRGDKELIVEMRNALPAILTRIDTLTARVAALEDALRPFALACEEMGHYPDMYRIIDGTKETRANAVYAKDFHKARTTLATTYPANEEG